MELHMDKTYLFREWKRLRREEQAFFRKNSTKRESGWQERIGKHVPEKLEDTLNTAFLKAFEVIFDQGKSVIEKTYNRQKKEQEYKIDEYAAKLGGNRRAVQRFRKRAVKSRNLNMGISAVEGIGMGLVGMGLPDIPLFLAVLLKSIYETSLHYGFSYETAEEQIFILKLIETPLLAGEEFAGADALLNEWMEQPFDLGDRGEQLQRTSDVLAKEMLYLKFVQGIPVVGIAGGISDVIYQKRILDYAELKYRRRFLLENIKCSGE